MPSKPRQRDFPWRCLECLKKTVRPAVLSYTIDVKHDGRLHSVIVPELRVPRCEECGGLVFGIDADEQVSDALREKLSLLKPDEIRTNRKNLSMKQKELAERLRVAPETICRWESGIVIQSRGMDTLLRLFFKVPAVRAYLETGQAASQCETDAVDMRDPTSHEKQERSHHPRSTEAQRLPSVLKLKDKEDEDEHWRRTNTEFQRCVSQQRWEEVFTVVQTYIEWFTGREESKSLCKELPALKGIAKIENRQWHMASFVDHFCLVGSLQAANQARKLIEEYPDSPQTEELRAQHDLLMKCLENNTLPLFRRLIPKRPEPVADNDETHQSPDSPTT